MVSSSMTSSASTCLARISVVTSKVQFEPPLVLYSMTASDPSHVPSEERRRSVTDVVHECCPDLEVENRTTVVRFPDAEGMETVQ